MCAVIILCMYLLAYIVCIYAISHYLWCTCIYHSCGYVCKCVKQMVLAWLPEHCQHPAEQQLSPPLDLMVGCQRLLLERQVSAGLGVSNSGRDTNSVWFPLSTCGIHAVIICKPVSGVLARRRHLQLLSVCPISVKTSCPQHSGQSRSTHTLLPSHQLLSSWRNNKFSDARLCR